MRIHKIVNKPVDSNCFVITFSTTNECIVIDPGTEDCVELIALLKNLNLNPKHIILTHEHFDHIWGVNFLKEQFDCSVICSAKCSEKIVNPKKNLSIFFNQEGFVCQPADIMLEDISYNLDFAGNTLQFFNTPGHSDASVSFVINDSLFVGDLLIKDTKTVTKLPGGNKQHLVESINLLKSRFDLNKTIVYPGHGEGFTLGDFENER